MCKGPETQTHTDLGSGYWLVHKTGERVVRCQTMKILDWETKGLGLRPGVSRTHKRALKSMGLFLIHSRKITLSAVRRTDWSKDRDPPSPPGRLI